jgi:hypothetical protein
MGLQPDGQSTQILQIPSTVAASDPDPFYIQKPDAKLARSGSDQDVAHFQIAMTDLKGMESADQPA